MPHATSVLRCIASGTQTGVPAPHSGPLPDPSLTPIAGFPSVGKSSLLTELTGTNSEAAAYEFTTLTCIPGVIHYNDAKIQLLDLPGIIEGAAQGKGRGRQVRTHGCTPAAALLEQWSAFCSAWWAAQDNTPQLTQHQCT